MIFHTVSPSVTDGLTVSNIMQMGMHAVYGVTYAMLGVYGLQLTVCYVLVVVVFEAALLCITLCLANSIPLMCQQWLCIIT